MALTKISRGLLNTGVADSSDATAITITAAEKVTVANSLNAPTSIQTPLIEYTDGDDAISIADGGAVTIAKAAAIGGTTPGTGAFTTLTSSGNLTVGGNLTVTGTSTVVDTVTMNAQNAVIFEGSTADNYETTLSIVDPTADHTQYLINQGGYIPVLAAVTTTAITSTPAELNLLDTAVANTVVNGKAVIYGGSGELAGTLSTAAQGSVTSLGTLTALTVDNLGINGNTITANSGALNLTPASGSAIVLDSTINVDAGVVTGATSITSTALVGALTGNASTATEATNVTVSANNSTDETVYPVFVDGATSTQGIESDTGLTYNPSSGILTSTTFVGALTGNASGTAATVTTAAQSAITSVGTLTGLTVNGAAVFNESGADVDFRIESDDNANIFFVDGGEDRVGIGTASPSTELHVKGGSGSSFIRIDNSADGQDTGFEIYQNGSRKWEIYSDDSNTDALDFRPGGNQKFIMTQDGKFGIGTTSPSHDLEVEATSPSITIDKGAAGYGTLRFYSGGAQKAYIQCDADEDLIYYAGSGSDNIFYSHGAEIMRMQSGTVGINRTASQANTKLEVGGADNVPLIAAEASGVFAGLGTVSAVSGAGIYVGTTARFVVASTGAIGINGANYGTDGQVFTSGGAGAAAAWETPGAASVPGLTNNSNATWMTVDSSENVGIGTTSPQQRLHIFQTEGGVGAKHATIRLGGYSTVGPEIAAYRVAGNSNDQGLVFTTHDSSGGFVDVMKINNAKFDGGGVLISGAGACINSTGASLFGYASPTKIGFEMQNTSSGGTHYAMMFRANATAEIGFINISNTATTYDTGSDYRLKENTRPLENGLSRVNQLNPIKFDWKSDGTSAEGFLAHEADEVFPDAVHGEKDGEHMQGIDYGRITPLLVKAIQELEAKLDAATINTDIEQRIHDLEQRLV